MEKKKKPFYTRWWFILILVLMLLSLLTSGLRSDKGKETPVAETQEVKETLNPETLTAEEPKVETQEPEVDENAEKREAFNKTIDSGSVMFDKEVRNDNTGRWRMLRYASGEDILNHAVDYYNAYFENDQELHVVINFSLGTTTILTISNGTMYADVHEYVDKEEHDAAEIGTGMILGHYSIDLKTGVIEKLVDE